MASKHNAFPSFHQCLLTEMFEARLTQGAPPLLSLLPQQVIPLALPVSTASLSCARRPFRVLLNFSRLLFFRAGTACEQQHSYPQTCPQCAFAIHLPAL
jgi:hypothetical protein